MRVFAMNFYMVSFSVYFANTNPRSTAYNHANSPKTNARFRFQAKNLRESSTRETTKNKRRIRHRKQNESIIAVRVCVAYVWCQIGERRLALFCIRLENRLHIKRIGDALVNDKTTKQFDLQSKTITSLQAYRSFGA